MSSKSRSSETLAEAVPSGIARTAGPGWHLLLAGPPHLWPDGQLAPVLAGRADVLTVHRLGEQSPWPGVAHGLVRPDGYLGYVSRGTGVDGLSVYLVRWLRRV
ncbi:hypothetical protein ACF05L_10870 [Streptomyces bobili]|uniref:hypothetical protein n=1 Tax=Streptomyces bobili TaxID=67280 RepID=UPI0036F5EB18